MMEKAAELPEFIQRGVKLTAESGMPEIQKEFDKQMGKMSGIIDDAFHIFGHEGAGLALSREIEGLRTEYVSAHEKWSKYHKRWLDALDAGDEEAAARFGRAAASYRDSAAESVAQIPTVFKSLSYQHLTDMQEVVGKYNAYLNQMIKAIKGRRGETVSRMTLLYNEMRAAAMSPGKDGKVNPDLKKEFDRYAKMTVEERNKSLAWHWENFSTDPAKAHTFGRYKLKHNRGVLAAMPAHPK